jgi:hypothetical protein
MARSKIPDPLERRHLVEREIEPGRALRIAEAYLSEGRTIEAIDFLVRGGALDRLEALRSEAIERGDVFELRSIATAMGRTPERAEWQTTAERADAAGKERYATEARRQADRGED